MSLVRTSALAAGWLLVAGTSSISAQVPPCDVFCQSRRADRAEAAGDYRDFAARVRLIVAAAPSHPGAVYAMARAFALTRQPDSAIAWLGRLGTMGDTRDPDADSVFRGGTTRPAYRAARARLLANRHPIIGGKPAFAVPDADFLPEGLAFDGKRARFLLGSLVHGRVEAMAPNVEPTVVVPHTAEMLRVVGVHVDQRRDRLWFATWAPDSATHADSTEAPSLTRLFLADRSTGRLVRSWTPDGGAPGHLLNDFVVMADGSLYITDTERGSIYALRSPADTLELFLQPDETRFAVANGITSSPDGRMLYVAFLQGIARVDLDSRTIALVPAPDSVSTASVDGLYWYRGSLIGVQGLPTLSRVVRYTLSRDGRRVTASQVLERGEPVVLEPTTGVIVGDRFYYIANSQYGRLDNSTSALTPQSGTPVRTVVRVIDLPH